MGKPKLELMSQLADVLSRGLAGRYREREVGRGGEWAPRPVAHLLHPTERVRRRRTSPQGGRLHRGRAERDGGAVYFDTGVKVTGLSTPRETSPRAKSATLRDLD